MNFSLRYAVKFAVAPAMLAMIVGCGQGDGSKELEHGKAAYEVRDLVKAGKMFEKCVKLAPENVDALVYLARVKLDLGNLDEAKSSIVKAEGLASGDTDITLLRAQLAWHEKDYAVAAKAYSEIAANVRLTAEERAQGFAGLGVVEMTCEHHHLARIAFMRAIRLDRKNASAWYHLGLLYRDCFDYPESALEQFDIFVRLEASASPRVQKVQRTIIPALKEKISRAATDRPGVAKRNSASAASAIAKAEAAWKKGAFKAARDAYQEAVKADPLSYPAALGLAKAWEKTDATKAGMAKAYDNYKIACTLRPSAISTFLAAGALAAKLGYFAQAVEIYSRAMAASPTSLEAIDGMIRSLRRSGNRQQVAEAYQGYRDSLSVRKKKK